MSTTLDGTPVTPVTLDKPRTLKYRYEDWLELSRRFGKSKFELLGMLSASDDPTIILCLWIGLRHEDKKLRDGDDIVPLVKAYLLADEEHNVSDFVKPIIAALKAARILHKTIEDRAGESSEATPGTDP